MSDIHLFNLKNKLSEKGFDGILISSVSNIFYLSGATFFEPTEHEGFLLITKDKNYLITSGLYAEAVQKYLTNFKLLEITIKKSLENNLKDAIRNQKVKKIGFEENSLTVSEYSKFKKILPLVPSGIIIEALRQIKDNGEIEKIKTACAVTDQTFEFIIKELKLGVTELYISNKLEEFYKSKNVTPSFKPVIAFGPNSSRPHHISTNAKLKKNQMVLMDFGVKFEGYCSDFTRTVFFGKADRKFKDIYSAVLEAQSKAFQYLDSKSSIVNGQLDIKLSDVDKVARDHIISLGFPNIPHSLGHSIGIEVHDGFRLSPTSKDKLKNDMVFSLEPGIYIPGYGGVRIEDLVLFQKVPKFLTLSNRDLIEI